MHLRVLRRRAPTDVKTVAILPFENLTVGPDADGRDLRVVREAMQDRLGLRQAGENQADAIVDRHDHRGTSPTCRSPSRGRRRQKGTSHAPAAPDHGGREDHRPAHREVIWENKGLIVEGDYETGKERDGRKKALEKLTTNIVDGAQSQW